MNPMLERELLDELLGLKAARAAYLDAAVTQSDVARYASADWFAREQETIFRAQPQIAAHASELAGEDAFLVRQIAGLPVLLTRDGDGEVHAFLNVCRHRGSRLVGEESGCRRRFSCPYHAWTWDNRGALKGVPHGAEGFPYLDKAALGLRRLACREHKGWIWLSAGTEETLEPAAYLEGLDQDFDWLDAGALTVAHTVEQDRAVNWKILVEGGIEAYHFRVAHRDTIGPYFPDNLSSYRMFGPHIRSVLPRATLPDLAEQPPENWSLRTHANLVYSVFPTSQLLVQQDHIVWIRLEPLAVDLTRLCLSTLVPAQIPSKPDASPAETARHWQTNHDITLRTLSEDFEIGEGIQAGMASGANTHLQFGRFEGALDQFNQAIDRLVGG